MNYYPSSLAVICEAIPIYGTNSDVGPRGLPSTRCPNTHRNCAW